MQRYDISSKTIDYLVYYHYIGVLEALIYGDDTDMLFSILERSPPSKSIVLHLIKTCMIYDKKDIRNRLEDYYDVHYTGGLCSIM